MRRLQTSGPAVTLAGADTSSASFLAPQVPVGTTATLGFAFTATDDAGAVTPDTVAVAVTSNDFIVYRADPTAGTVELFRVGVEPGSPPPIKLSGPMVAGGSVLGFEISPDGSRVVYHADQDTNGVQELYLCRPDASAPAIKVSQTPMGGNVYEVAWRP